MSIYAIGDIQGCFNELLKLLDVISFNPNNDQLWFTGDLVNRGPNSLETLRFVKSLGESAVTVLGNHDIHLLVESCIPKKRAKDYSLNNILTAKDKDELIDWLRQRPLFHYNNDYCLLHAGLPPQWDIAQTKKMALLVEQNLQHDNYQDFLKHIYGNQPDIWSDELQGIALKRFIINCFTRIRFCDRNGRLDFEYNGKVNSQPENLLPWFAVPNRKSINMPIIFGHWAALGFYQGYNCYGIDTGCVWGGQLTAIKLANPIERFSVPCLHK